MLNFFKSVFGLGNEKAVKKLMLIVEEVGLFEDKFKELSDEDIGEKTKEFRQRLESGATEDDILPEAFALVREAAYRSTGMRPFDVQVLGGIVLHQGRIAEMKTGEGKTLVATMPAYLNALSGKGVHIVTVNDYLAKRDSEWMGPVYRMLGLSVGVVVHDLSSEERRKAYGADIVYGTNNEFGFDYLRDNMVIYKEQMVQRELNFAIVDEVDSILIDEARTPLIISSKGDINEGYRRWNNVVAALTKKQRRLVNTYVEKAQKCLEAGEKEEAGELLLLAKRGAPRNKNLLKLLKEPGVEKLTESVKQRLSLEKRDKTFYEDELYYQIEEANKGVDIAPKGYEELVKEDVELREFLGYDEEPDDEEGLEEAEEKNPGDGAMEDMNEEEFLSWQKKGEHEGIIRTLLKAYSLFEKDVDYVVKDGQVIIVDEFTGRLMPGRRYSDGLHQAIEAKENVAVQAESRTVASITFQNYFRLYEKISGMTGTALTEEEEFRNIYFMDVVAVPTNRPMAREDFSDRIYKTAQGKYRAVVEEIAQCHERGQPVLVGTVSVERSEMLSKVLKRRGIPHNVLNAVNNFREAEIISQAGQKGSVTISTNMAGRGTDIVLGGNYEYIAREQVQKEIDAREEDLAEKERDRLFAERLQEVLPVYRERWEKDNESVLSLGGLHVLGTERHESRRIDNQLRGRSGRQGDPGSSCFYISLEDDLMRLFGGGNIGGLMDRFGFDEDQPIDHPLLGKAIENAQKKVENRNFEIRKHLLNYDTVLNEQRKVVYNHRRQVLEEADLKETVTNMIHEVIDGALRRFTTDRNYLDEDTAGELLYYANEYFLPPSAVSLEDIMNTEPRYLKDLFIDKALSFYEKREKDINHDLGEGSMRELERVILLRTVDKHWIEHIDAMHDLRHEIGNRLDQRDPLVIYRIEASRAYEFMLNLIAADVVKSVFRAQVKALPRRERVVKGTTAVRAGTAAQSAFRGAGTGTGSSRGSEAPSKEKTQPVRVEDKVGRNEPCPCGSGKKYKKCCAK